MKQFLVIALSMGSLFFFPTTSLASEPPMVIYESSPEKFVVSEVISNSEEEFREYTVLFHNTNIQVSVLEPTDGTDLILVFVHTSGAFKESIIVPGKNSPQFKSNQFIEALKHLYNHRKNHDCPATFSIGKDLQIKEIKLICPKLS